MVSKLLFIFLFILSFLLAERFVKKREAEKYTKKNNPFYQSNDNIKKILKKFLFLKSKDEFLSKQGYPFKLNAITYYLTKIILVVFFGLSSYLNYDNSFVTLFFRCNFLFFN